MSSRIVYSPKYKPLFLPAEKRGWRYTVITGGRGSGKSHATASANVCSTFDDPYNILYSRYTLTSAELSIIPEYVEKIDALGLRGGFKISKTTIRNLRTSALVFFRGLLQSSSNQTGRLKSINKLKRWFLDEAQELENKTTFETIDLSIREKEVNNEVWMALNPTDIHHWIYKEFFKKPGIPYDFNGRVDDTYYVHTDWRDNRANLSESFIQKALKMEREDPEKYYNLYLGGWAIKRNGLIYPRWEQVRREDIPLGLEWWYGNDWGYSNDPDALIRMAFDPLTRTLYVVQVMYSTGKLPRDVAAAIREDCARMGMDPDRAVVYCDPARPDSIAELRGQYGINALPGINRDKTGRIGYLQGFRVRYVGDNIGEEVQTYSWEPSKEDPEVFTDTPQDGGDHCFVGSTLVTTIDGEKRIDEIRPGDKVLTSKGYRKVLRVFDNGYKEIRDFQISFCKFGVEITATPDHKVKTQKGWKQLKELCATDVLFLSRSSMERNTTFIQESAISADTSDFVATLVQLPIVSISTSKARIERVFDLNVEDMHEYLANGVLVHNCMDACSYATTYLRRMGIPNDDCDIPK